jgi:hypothetical protein
MKALAYVVAIVLLLMVFGGGGAWLDTLHLKGFISYLVPAWWGVLAIVVTIFVLSAVGRRC